MVGAFVFAPMAFSPAHERLVQCAVGLAGCAYNFWVAPSRVMIAFVLILAAVVVFLLVAGRA